MIQITHLAVVGESPDKIFSYSLKFKLKILLKQYQIIYLLDRVLLLLIVGFWYHLYKYHSFISNSWKRKSHPKIWFLIIKLISFFPLKGEKQFKMVQSNSAANNNHSHQVFDMALNIQPQIGSDWLDDDGRPKRTGNRLFLLNLYRLFFLRFGRQSWSNVRAFKLYNQPLTVWVRVGRLKFTYVKHFIHRAAFFLFLVPFLWLTRTCHFHDLVLDYNRYSWKSC